MTTRTVRFAGPAAYVCAALVVAGCAAPAPSPESPPAETPTVEAPTTMGTARGWTLRIPTVEQTSTLATVGLNPDRTMATPPVDTPEQAAHYDGSPLPGDVGPAVIVCHVNGAGRPGCGARWSELAAGDDVWVDRPGGVARFVVGRVQTVAKGEFPRAEVYSDTAGPELRLITCGGELDEAARSYESNVIVYATLA